MADPETTSETGNPADDFADAPEATVTAPAATPDAPEATEAPITPDLDAVPEFNGFNTPALEPDEGGEDPGRDFFGYESPPCKNDDERIRAGREEYDAAVRTVAEIEDVLAKARTWVGNAGRKVSVLRPQKNLHELNLEQRIITRPEFAARQEARTALKGLGVFAERRKPRSRL